MMATWENWKLKIFPSFSSLCVLPKRNSEKKIQLDELVCVFLLIFVLFLFWWETCTGPDFMKRKKYKQTNWSGKEEWKHISFLPIKAVSFFDIRRRRYSAPLFERGYKCVSFQARKKKFFSLSIDLLVDILSCFLNRTNNGTLVGTPRPARLCWRGVLGGWKGKDLFLHFSGERKIREKKGAEILFLVFLVREFGDKKKSIKVFYENPH